MKNFPFLGMAPEAILAELQKPITGFRLLYVSVPGPIKIVVHHSDGSSISINSIMNGVEDRFEIGSLHFNINENISYDGLDIVAYDFSKEKKIINVEKLIYKNEKVLSESGIKIHIENGESVHVVSGSYPYSLFLHGKIFRNEPLLPEYRIEEYSISPMAP